MKLKIFIGILFIAVGTYPMPRGAIYVASYEGQFRIQGSTNVGGFMLTVPINTTQFQYSDHGKVISLEIKIPIVDFNADIPLMVRDFRAMMEYRKYPEMALRFSLIPDEIHPGTLNKVVEIELRNRKLLYTIQLVATQYDYPDSWLLYGVQEIRLSELGITPPTRMLGLVRVNDKLSITFALEFDFRNPLITKHEVQYKSKIRSESND